MAQSIAPLWPSGLSGNLLRSKSLGLVLLGVSRGRRSESKCKGHSATGRNRRSKLRSVLDLLKLSKFRGGSEADGSDPGTDQERGAAEAICAMQICVDAPWISLDLLGSRRLDDLKQKKRRKDLQEIQEILSSVSVPQLLEALETGKLPGNRANLAADRVNDKKMWLVEESETTRSLEPEEVSQTSSVLAEREEYERQIELSNDLNQHLRQLQDQFELDSNYEWDDGWGFGLPMDHAVQSKRSRGYSDSWYMTTTSLSEDIEESPRQRAKMEKESLQQAAEEAHRQKITREKEAKKQRSEMRQMAATFCSRRCMLESGIRMADQHQLKAEQKELRVDELRCELQSLMQTHSEKLHEEMAFPRDPCPSELQGKKAAIVEKKANTQDTVAASGWLTPLAATDGQWKAERSAAVRRPSFLLFAWETCQVTCWLKGTGHSWAQRVDIFHEAQNTWTAVNYKEIASVAQDDTRNVYKKCLEEITQEITQEETRRNKKQMRFLLPKESFVGKRKTETSTLLNLCVLDIHAGK
eukprot:Skav226250  [mRNA]  locus=scaffold2708:31699:44373:- [translate_table: standard]